MAELRVIAAGAGTGKTHRLAAELVSALVDDVYPVPPEAVVAVTYTRAAAAELESRVRTALFDHGRPDLAKRTAAARIGTVHSVCARLIEEHAFALGLPPDLTTLDAPAAASLFDDALAACVSDDERRILDDLEQRFFLSGFGGSFEGLVRDVVDRARNNDVDDATLALSMTDSIDGLLGHLPPAVPAADVEQPLINALTKVLESQKAGARLSQERQEEIDLFRLLRSRLERGEGLRWQEWLSLEQNRFNDVKKAAQRHIEHEGLHADLRLLTTLVFDVARRSIARYTLDKRAAGVIDFIDQERLALEVVRRADLAPTIARDVQLLLVDEFQDTDPLQLQLFDALRHVAARTVVVGDEKQTIFGFRDASPELFKAFTAQAAVTDRLGISHRSRPALVRAVSGIFATAFAGPDGQGLRAADVTLDPVANDDPTVLGAHLERWTGQPLDQFGEVLKDEAVVAAGIAEMLSSRDVTIRARGPREAKGSGPGDGLTIAQPKDIAVLCRTNAQCRAFAAALEERGVPVQLRQHGLAETWEARIVEAALTVWIDDGDALARATLVHGLTDPTVVGSPGDPEDDDVGGDVDGDRDTGEGPQRLASTTIAEMVQSEPYAAFVHHPLVQCVRDARQAHPLAGLVQTFDRIVDVLRLDERCRDFPSPSQHRADLGALRALAVRLVDDCVVRGQAPTVARYVDRLHQLRRGDTRWGSGGDSSTLDDNSRGDVTGRDAVEVLTWHKAKGREWPVVVLSGCWSDGFFNPFEADIDVHLHLPTMDNPLQGRRVRFWPNPYGRTPKYSSLVDRLRDAPPVARKKRQLDAEALRLLYVGFTRARDRVVVVGDQTIWSKGLFSQMVDAQNRPLCSDPIDGVATWSGIPLQAEVRHPRPRPGLIRREDEWVPSLRPPAANSALPTTTTTTTTATATATATTTQTTTQRAPAFLQPSAQEAIGEVGERVTLGPVLMPPLVGDDYLQLNHLGQCLHAYLAWDAFVDIDDPRRYQRAALMRQRFDVEAMVSAQDIVGFASQLWRGLDQRFPGHRRRTEVPMLHRRAEGSLVRGQIDLLLDLDEHTSLIIDHKTTRSDDVGGYAGQLMAYARGVEASGRKVPSLWIHLPLLGQLVEVLPPASPAVPGPSAPTSTSTSAATSAATSASTSASPPAEVKAPVQPTLL